MTPVAHRYKSNEEYVYVRGRGRGKYVCEECGIRCKKPSMLKKHIRTHTDVRPYVCKYCNFAFKTKGKRQSAPSSSAQYIDLQAFLGALAKGKGRPSQGLENPQSQREGDKGVLNGLKFSEEEQPCHTLMCVLLSHGTEHWLPLPACNVSAPSSWCFLKGKILK